MRKKVKNYKGLFDFPGSSLAHQALQAGARLFLDNRGNLLGDRGLKRFRRLAKQNPKNDRKIRWSCIDQHLGQNRVGFVVDQNIIDSFPAVANRNDLQGQLVTVEGKALFAFLAKQQRVPMDGMELQVGGRLAVGKFTEHCVIEDNAILENLNKTGALVFFGPLENGWHVLLIGIDGAGDKAGAGSECKRAG